MSFDVDSLERLVPDEVQEDEVTGRETLRLHLERYEFAAREAQGARILDLACGVGYGTRLLRERVAGASRVVGVDLSEQAIEFARRRYLDDGMEFVCRDAASFEDGEGFDTIVSLETIEHVEAPGPFVQQLLRLLKPGGRLIASVPTTPSVDFNPHHRSDFTAGSFRRLFAGSDLVERARFEQVQRVDPLDVLRRSEARMKEARPDLVRYYARHPGALARRIAATVRHGFCNKYLTLSLERPAGGGERERR